MKSILTCPDMKIPFLSRTARSLVTYVQTPHCLWTKVLEDPPIDGPGPVSASPQNAAVEVQEGASVFSGTWTKRYWWVKKNNQVLRNVSEVLLLRRGRGWGWAGGGMMSVLWTDSEHQRHVRVLKMRLDHVMEFLSVLIKMHDALWLLGDPEFIKFKRQVTCVRRKGFRIHRRSNRSCSTVHSQ